MTSDRYRVAVVVGSVRRESINRRLATAITRLSAPTLEWVDIAIDGMPIYNGDLEGSRPDSVDRFTAAVAACDALLVVSPEHNRSITTLLKNAIDWGSKPADKNVWRDKPALMTGASPGAMGTGIGQQHLRQILGTLGCIVLGGEAYISFKPGFVDEHGEIADPKSREFLQGHVDRFADLVGRVARRQPQTAAAATAETSGRPSHGGTAG